jgi:hypothetical protein
MKYDDQQVTGNAGEFLMGLVVNKKLKWIYEPAKWVGIGLDGEIGLCDSEQNVTGKIIKVQVRAYKAKIIQSISVSGMRSMKGRASRLKSCKSRCSSPISGYAP